MPRRSLRILVFLLVLPALWSPPVSAGEMLEPGMPFPAFSLPAHDGTVVSSADLAGKWVLVYFYPKADTPGCTREACELRDSWPEVQAEGLVVLGVSYDTPEANRAFAEKYHLPFLLLSDRDRELAAQVGAKRALIPVPRRISYLVAPDGTVARAYAQVDPATHAGEVLRDLRRLKAEATPEASKG